jgi:hypothetical protein
MLGELFKKQRSRRGGGYYQKKIKRVDPLSEN